MPMSEGVVSTTWPWAERRADGVKKVLLVGGAKEGQIESVSYGEEKPMSTAHNEAAWSQNRRTDLNYNAK